MKSNLVRLIILTTGAALVFDHPPAAAWDYEGHRVVNQLALASLPPDFPDFVRGTTAAERIAFLSGEPDRWRNTPDLTLKHANEPDHYLDIEELAEYGLKPQSLPVFRYDFVARLAVERLAHPDKFPALDPGKDVAHTRQLVGLLPWAIAENYGKVKSGFSALKAFETDGGTAEEIANAQANIIYIMGVMGHYVGDAAQPLHTTIHHHGWATGRVENPGDYSTNSHFHSWIDGGFFAKVGGVDVQSLRSRLRPAQPVRLDGRPARPEEMFQATMMFINEQHQLVGPLYQLEKEGKLSGEGETGLAGKVFLEGQILKAAQMLGDLWYSAWRQAPPDTFLKSQLAKRKAAR